MSIRRRPAGVLIHGPAELSLIVPAGGSQVDAQQLWAQLCDDDRRSDGAIYVGHGITDRNSIQNRLGRRGVTHAIDLVGSHADRCGNGLRSCIYPGGVADIETSNFGDGHHGQQAEQADDDCEDDLPRSLLAEAGKELRANAITDREQKQQEEGRLDRPIDGQPDLSNKDRSQEGCCYISKGKPTKLLWSDPKSDRERGEDSQLRICADSCDKPLSHYLTARSASRCEDFQTGS